MNEKIASEDEELVRDELAWVAEWLKKRYPAMNFRQINCFLHEKLDVSV